MKKLNILWIILGSIVFVMFNVLFYTTGMMDDNTFSTWSTYAFIVISFVVFIATPILTGRYKIKKRIFGLQPTEFGAVYFAVQLALGLIYLLSGFEKSTPAFLIQLFMLAAYAIILIVNLIVSEKANEKYNKTESTNDEENR
jgi:Na+/melibiose symporter-like transporter